MYALRRPSRIEVNLKIRRFPLAGHAVMDRIVAQTVDDYIRAVIMPSVFALTLTGCVLAGDCLDVLADTFDVGVQGFPLYGV